MDPNKTPIATSVPAPSVAPTAPTATPAPAGPKYVLTGDSLEELCVSLAEVIINTGGFTTKDNKSGNGSRYAIWALDDGMSSNPLSKGWGLTEQQARRLNTKDGAPPILSVDILMRQLTPVHNVKAKLAERNAAVATRESNLEAQLEAIRARKRTQQ